MGTKNTPGKFDCYSKLEPDEPHFVLMGRDPAAALLIRLWAILREPDSSPEKIAEANDCAAACYQYAKGRGKDVDAVISRFADHLIAKARAMGVNKNGT